jgi:hypothetical protein
LYEILAERVGFEPTVPLQVRRISSAVHSTTLPPLRGAQGASIGSKRVGRDIAMKNGKCKIEKATIVVSFPAIALTGFGASRTRMSGKLRMIVFAACFGVCQEAGIKAYLTGGGFSAKDQPTEQKDRPTEAFRF